MKKLICFLMIAFVAFVISPMVAMAETVASAAVENSTSIDIASYFATVPGLVSLVIIVTQFLKKLLKTEGVKTQILSWIIALALSCVGYFLQLGIFVGAAWYWIIIYAAAAGLIANGIATKHVVEAVLNLIKPKLT
ncbi:hypothetical protein [Marinifilum flexuosum]|uniref:Uncharacterized protein n=1 Tax=Marinifilum flexuosum TaxID=1117708 RepID=A0A419X3M4_9BACT|nr:hypothetical protein [Marinifilum flexuosum]RKE02307.1 hypothetical protein BXY64_2395 [Marinifilum flexuosum]